MSKDLEIAVVHGSSQEHLLMELGRAAEQLVGLIVFSSPAFAPNVIRNLLSEAVESNAARLVAAEMVIGCRQKEICEFRGLGKNVLGHSTFTPVGELVLADSD